MRVCRVAFIVRREHLHFRADYSGYKHKPAVAVTSPDLARCGARIGAHCAAAASAARPASVMTAAEWQLLTHAIMPPSTK